MFQKLWIWLGIAKSGVDGFKYAWAELATTIGMSSAALGWLVGIGVIIAGAIAIFDGLTTSVKEAQESLQEFKKATEVLENTKSELESINDKIEERK